MDAPGQIGADGMVGVYLFASKDWVRRNSVDAREICAVGSGSLTGPTEAAPTSIGEGGPEVEPGLESDGAAEKSRNSSELSSEDSGGTDRTPRKQAKARRGPKPR